MKLLSKLNKSLQMKNPLSESQEEEQYKTFEQQQEIYKTFQKEKDVINDAFFQRKDDFVCKLLDHEKDKNSFLNKHRDMIETLQGKLDITNQKLMRLVQFIRGYFEEKVKRLRTQMYDTSQMKYKHQSAQYTEHLICEQIAILESYEKKENTRLERQCNLITTDILHKCLKENLQIYDKDILFTQEQLVRMKKELDRKVIQSCYKLQEIMNQLVQMKKVQKKDFFIINVEFVMVSKEMQLLQQNVAVLTIQFIKSIILKNMHIHQAIQNALKLYTESLKAEGSNDKDVQQMYTLLDDKSELFGRQVQSTTSINEYDIQQYLNKQEQGILIELFSSGRIIIEAEQLEQIKGKEKISLQDMSLLLTDFNVDNHDLKLDTLLVKRSGVTSVRDEKVISGELLLTIDGYLLHYEQIDKATIDVTKQKNKLHASVKSLRFTPLSNNHLKVQTIDKGIFKSQSVMEFIFENGDKLEEFLENVQNNLNTIY